ncbi:MAG TPA: hypothetical protein PKD37_02050 [Oligoflexia bacterium]|nr:hypothetical protein [Oligoflexia bacterium]HMP26759.1 hypothetical protein [Oligoflexia bacterium]
MISKFWKLFTLVIVAGLTTYLVILNSNSTTITLKPGSPITANTGVIILLIFLAGILVASLFAFWFGFRGYLRERKLIAKDRARRALIDGMLKARGLFASGDFTRAKEEWQYLAKRDESNLVAKIEIANCEIELSNLESASRILEDLRALHPHNEEVLLLGYKIYSTLGNKTAALDNLKLLLVSHPTKQNYKLAYKLAEELGNLNGAIEFINRLQERFGLGLPETSDKEQILLKITLLENKNNKQKLKEALKNFCKRHPESIEATRLLAQTEKETGSPEEIGLTLLKLAKLTNKASDWENISSFWLEQENPEKAITSAKLWINESGPNNKATAHLNLARVYLDLNMSDLAKEQIQKVAELCLNNQEICKELCSKAALIEAIYLLRNGDRVKAIESINSVIRGKPSFFGNISYLGNNTEENGSNYNKSDMPPSPTLSTP